MIEGGAGDDTAVYGGNRADYDVTVNSEGVTISDRVNGSGTDFLTNVEFFQFANGKLSLATLVGNEAPTAVSISERVVAENAANGVVIGSLATNDANTDDIHTYQLVDNAGGRFALVNGSLVVANGSLLDYEQAASHQVTVRATDLAGLSVDQVLTIDLSDVNEAPAAIALTNASVAENSGNGTIVGTLSATDPDAGDTRAFTLLNDAGGRFAIVDGNLVIANGSLLDYEQAASHQVTVRATDAKGLSIDAILTVSLSDVLNENVTGTSGSDYLVGGAGNDRLDGGAGTTSSRRVPVTIG